MMRIVAGRTQAESDGTVDDFLRVKPPFMAKIAKLSFLSREFKSMLSGIVHVLFVDRLMAAHAFAGGDRSVNIALLRQIAVTTETRLFLRCGRERRAGRHQEPKSHTAH